jgi:hypothetical protein
MTIEALSTISRRVFLKKAGVGTLALGSLPILGKSLATRALAADETTSSYLRR